MERLESNFYVNSNGKQMIDPLKRWVQTHFRLETEAWGDLVLWHYHHYNPWFFFGGGNWKWTRGQTKQSHILPLRIYNNKAVTGNLALIHLGSKEELLPDCVGLLSPVHVGSPKSDLENTRSPTEEVLLLTNTRNKTGFTERVTLRTQAVCLTRAGVSGAWNGWRGRSFFLFNLGI